MAETVADSRYQPRHHRLSESNWDRRAVRRQRVVDANAHFGYPGALLLDESAFGKKGNMSAGVARQWNGRLGKVEDVYKRQSLGRPCISSQSQSTPASDRAVTVRIPSK